jgi:flagellar biosynthetic protein FliS
MSYDAATKYRMDVGEYASPVGVIVQAYDQVVGALRRAAADLEGGHIEHKTQEIDRVLLLVVHLQSMLDHEAGPRVAATLNAFYETMRFEIVKASAQPMGEPLRQVATYFSKLHSAWQVVEREHPALPLPSLSADGEYLS